MKRPETDLISTIKPFYNILRLMGLAPYSLPCTKQASQSNPRAELRYTVKYSLICTPTFMSIAISMFFFDLDTFQKGNKVDKMIIILDLFLNVGLVASYLVLVICGYLHRDKSTKMLFDLKRVDKILFEVHPNYKRASTLMWANIGFQLVFPFVMYGMEFFRMIPGLSVAGILISSWITLACLLLNFYMSVGICQPISWLMIVANKLAAVNSELKRICKPPTEHGEESRAELPLGSEASEKSALTAKDICKGRSRPSRVSQLMCAHLKIVDIVSCLNDIYGFTLLFLVLSLFLTIIFSIFFIVKLPLENNSSASYLIGSRSVWIVYFVLLTIALTKSGSKCCQRIEETTLLLQEMIVDETVPCEELRSNCLKFLDQIANTEMKLTAHGFFDVDLRLLGSMAGAATTYLVILLQIK